MKYVLILSLGVLASFQVMAQDADFDGIDDSIDRCPNTAQLKKVDPSFRYHMTVNPERLQEGQQAYPVDKHGCELDNDRDGVVNSQDYCPDNTELEISKGISKNGCPKHSDQDGVPDFRDKCPGTERNQKSDKFGCPVTRQ